MPFLPPSIKESAIFLYKSVGDAEAGAEGGGTGFLMGVPSEAAPSRVHLYAVSNDHVSRGHPVVRLMHGDMVEIVPGASTDWVEHPKGDDVAVRPLGAVPANPSFGSVGLGSTNPTGYQYLSPEQLLTPDDLRFGVGPVVGDDCLMVGRYINHEGRQFDRAVVRFGNLSMWPEVIKQYERSFDQESFLVDMRSVSGFSGSQVIIYFSEPGTLSLLSGPGAPQMPFRDLISKYWVLGIDWGHLPVSETIIEAGARKRVKVKSSMAAVVPAWKLTELLNDVEDIVKPRAKAEAELAKVNEHAAELDVDSDSESEFDRFEMLAGQIIKVPKADIDQKRKES